MTLEDRVDALGRHVCSALIAGRHDGARPCDVEFGESSLAID